MFRLGSVRLYVVLCTAIAGCGPQVASEGTQETGSAEDTTGAPSPGSTSSTTQPMESSSSDTGSTSIGAESSSSTGGAEPLIGPGCEEPVPCTGDPIEGSVRVATASDLDQLRGVATVTGHLEISTSDLVCLDALACLTEVGATVRIQDNAELRSTAGMSGLSSVGEAMRYGRGLIITDNPQLEVLEGFPIEVFDGSVLLWRNESLRASEAFDELRVLDSLSVQDNPALESLTALHGLGSLEHCNVSRNGSLCASEIYAVCQNAQEGEVVLNDDSC